ncbi:hypothetical protein T459_14111 [Capsicum annuum]|uniref:NB-ARC domain-containing protein n=1 Tax=Capsicum annuum TaxID=4072 RepID=A0A2G2ZGH5_CAPAN|nr:hypothetical protein T459_14111 [Capsicum annuum]
MQKKSKVGIKEFNNGCLKPTIVNDVVAILETYSFETGKGDGFVSRLKACACICRKETKFYRVEKEITLLEQQIMDISRKRETYGIADTNNAGEGPNSKSGSKVIITTRKEDVAERADDRGSVQRLRFLSRKESWDLFSRKLLDVWAVVPEMERLARDMVGKCGDLPLAIVVLSSLLLPKRGLEEWKKFPALEFLKSSQKLHKLGLDGRIEKLPLMDSFPNSITLMSLSHSELMDDAMPILRMLPNLRNLELEAAYEGKEITCSDNSFS